MPRKKKVASDEAVVGPSSAAPAPSTSNTGPSATRLPPSIAFDPADRALRPQRLADFIGQPRVVDQLKLAIDAARTHQEPLDHLLFSGPPGLGKTTLASLIAKEVGSELRSTSGHLLEKPGDLASILSALKPNDVLFIDEIHCLKREVEEYLYSAMEDYKITIHLGEGASVNAMTIPLSPFTVVGATTREGLLSAPFRARFGLSLHLEPYQTEDLVSILRANTAKLGQEAETEGLTILAERSRGTARIANALLRRARDMASVRHRGVITQAVAIAAMDLMGIDALGLTEIDRRILSILARSARPIGLRTIADQVDEDEATIEEAYEPWLLRQRLMIRMANGRTILPAGQEHLIAHGVITRDELPMPLAQQLALEHQRRMQAVVAPPLPPTTGAQP